MYNNNPMIRMEKRAVNKVGFVLIVLLAIAALVGGIYFVYKNRNNLDFSLPWAKDKKEQKEEEQTKKEEQKIALERQKVKVTDAVSYADFTVRITPRTVNYDDNEGYKIELLVSNRGDALEYEIYGLDIDNYQVDYFSSFTAQAKTPHAVTITIDKEALDLYRIETFNKIRLYIRRKGKEKNESGKISVISVKNGEIGDNVQTPKTISNVGNADDIKIDYLRKEETDDETNVYFLVTNSKKTLVSYSTLIVNAYKVNGEIITDSDFKEDIYDTNKKIVKLTIPKSKFKTVDNLTISFFIRRNDDIFTTKETTIDFNKK